MRPKSKYNGVKKVEEWIKDNLFEIHEYNSSRSEQIWEKLCFNLIEEIASCTKNINIKQTTKLNDVVNIKFTRNKDGRKRFTLLIHEKPKQIKVR
jgi:hypothetical protein